jgi:hypothetical protein
VIDRVNKLLRGYEEAVRERDESWDFHDGVISYRGVKLLDSAKRENLEELKNFVIESSNELREEFRKLLELENEYYEKRKASIEGFVDLLKRIDSEMPLMGSCSICEDIGRVVKVYCAHEFLLGPGDISSSPRGV